MTTTEGTAAQQTRGVTEVTGQGMEREELESVPAGRRNGRVDAGWKFQLVPFN